MKTVLIVAALLLTSSALAQTPYAGMQSRPIKALSEQQVTDLQAGRGMGLALAAELNGYPGPSHVLDLVDRLNLSQEQRTRVLRLFEEMKQESLPLGARLIEQEADLDRQFASRSVTSDSLKAATAAIGQTQSVLRETHLRYHLSTAALLTTDQMQRYAELRGYGGQASHQQHHHHN